MSRAYLALLLPMFTLHGCTPLDDEGARLDDACAVAITHTTNFKRAEVRPIAVRTRASSDGPTIEELDAILLETPQALKDPDLILLRQAAETQNVSVIDRCPSLKTWLSKNAVIFSDPEIDRLARKEPWPVSVLTMSVPAISEDGSTAMLFASEYWGGLGGGTDMVVYRKQAGAWVLQRRVQLSIS